MKRSDVMVILLGCICFLLLATTIARAEDAATTATQVTSELQQSGVVTQSEATAIQAPLKDTAKKGANKEKKQKIKLEEQLKEEEEARRRQEEFERTKQEALKNMKGITESEPGLKGVDKTGGAGLRGIGQTREEPFRLRGGGVSDPCPGNLTCFTYFCGGASEHPYVCCPKGAPYLNHCDCRCYSSSDFDCNSYSKCESR